MKNFFLVYVLLCFQLFASATEKISITTKSKSTEHALGIDKFYFIHHFFADPFYMTSAHNDVTKEEIRYFVNELYTKLTLENSVEIEIKRQKGVNAWFEFSVIKKGEEKIIVMRTNYNSEDKGFIKNHKDENNFVRFYFIKGVKLVYRKDVYSSDEEAKRKAEGKSTLAEFYLFNDKVEDDELVLSLINPILEDSTSAKRDILYALLYKMEVELRNKNHKEAEAIQKQLAGHFEMNKSVIGNQYKLIVTLAEMELYLN